MKTRLAALVAGLCLAATPGAAQDPPRPPEPKRLALLVGCSEYPNLKQALGEPAYERDIRLEGPANDVELVRATLERVLGLAPEDTTVLAGWGAEPALRPTKDNIIGHLERLAREARAGDSVIVYLAGHGAQQPVRRERLEEEPDSLDEVFLAADAGRADASGHIPSSIRDDELGARLRAIRDAGADVWLIVDACHSGTMLRGGTQGVRLRGLSPELLGVPATTRGRRDTGRQQGWIGNESSARIAALYGAQSYGRAPEMPLPLNTEGADVHGVFSYVLCAELERTGASGTYKELAERVIAAYQALPCGHTVPMAEGQLDREIRSGAVVEAPGLLCTLVGGVPRLNHGRLAGVERGLVARVLAANGRDVLARVEVVEASLHEARCKLLDDSELAGGTSWTAVVEERPLGDWSLALAVVRADGSPATTAALPEATRQALASDARFPIVAPADADWWIVSEGADLWLRPGPREGGFDAFGVSAATLVVQLDWIRRARSLRGFAGGGRATGWSGEIDVWIERRRAEEERGERLGPDAVLHPGDQVRVLLSKRSARLFDVHAFYLDGDFGLTMLYPFEGASARLAEQTDAEIRLTNGWIPIVDNGLGLESLVAFAIPRTSTSPVVDLKWLPDGQRPVLRGEPAAEAFEQLLDEFQRGNTLRGEPLRAPAMDEGPQSLLLTVRTEWGALRPPDWPAQGVVAIRPPAVDARVPPPDFWDSGAHAALARSHDGVEGSDLLLLGDAGVRAVLVDLDGAAPAGADAAQLVREKRFDADVAFVFEPSRALAYYDRKDSGVHDLVLVDLGRDGVAEERWVLVEGTWRSTTGVALPWLSQCYLTGVGGEQVERTRRLRCLQAE